MKNIVNRKDIKQKLIAGTQLTPEELSLVSQVLDEDSRQFQWYIDDLRNWKEFCGSLLEQNRSLTLMCQKLTSSKQNETANH